VSEGIRAFARDARHLALVPEAEFLLYVARDVQLIEENLRPALARGDLVIADRFLYTAEVLARFGRHLPESFTAPVLQAAAGTLAPELVILIDVDPALARARRKSAKLAAGDERAPSRKGLGGVGLQHRLRHGYQQLATADAQRWVTVNNEAPLPQVVDSLAELIDDAHRHNVSAALKRFRTRRSQPASAAAAAAVRSVEDALEQFLRRVDGRVASEPQVAAHLLGGLSGPPVDQRRRSLAAAVPRAVIAGSEGLDDETSWSLRQDFAHQHPRTVALSLTRLAGNNARAAAMRLDLKGEAPAQVALSLTAIDDDGAFALRELLFDRAPDAVMTSLAGLGSARAWTLRDRWWSQSGADVAGSYPAALTCARSVAGLDDQRAWELREKARPAAPVAALASLGGADSDRAWRWRQEALPRAPKVVMNTLFALRDARAWEMRAAVAPECKEALDSVFDMDDAPAWDLRESHCDRWPSTVVKSLGTLALLPRGRALVERQLAHHPDNLSLLKHAAAVALGLAAGVPANE
ncbi:MAG TPA: dTMP kinase, partial [Polyangia bacterium]|nr:dTMP kinase [Polyangia bacterium]